MWTHEVLWQIPWYFLLMSQNRWYMSGYRALIKHKSCFRSWFQLGQATVWIVSSNHYSYGTCSSNKGGNHHNMTTIQIPHTLLQNQFISRFTWLRIISKLAPAVTVEQFSGYLKNQLWQNHASIHCLSKKVRAILQERISPFSDLIWEHYSNSKLYKYTGQMACA